MGTGVGSVTMLVTGGGTFPQIDMNTFDCVHTCHSIACVYSRGSLARAYSNASLWRRNENDRPIWERKSGRKLGRKVAVRAEKGGSDSSAGGGETVGKQLGGEEVSAQIEERKKLYSTLLNNASDPTVQIKAFKDVYQAIQKKSDQIRAFNEAISQQDSKAKASLSDKGKSLPMNKNTPLNSPLASKPRTTAWPSPLSPAPTSKKSDSLSSALQTPVHPHTPPMFPSSVTPPANSVAAPLLLKDTESASTKQPDLTLPVSEPHDAAVKEVKKAPPLAGPNVMNVVFVAAECAPWSKTGGLGDVAGALPKALARRGHRVMALSPRYSNYAEAWDTSVRVVFNVAGQDREVGYFHTYIDGVDYVFIDSPMFHSFSSNIYGGSREDVLIRMILLCKAAVEAPWHVPCGGICYGDSNLVFIANDWHTALLPVYLQAYYREKGLMIFARSLLVIHNMAHQGRGPMTDFAKLGLPDHYANFFVLDDPIGGRHCNIFKAGLIAAHRIVAVSHGYASECQTQIGGWGLDGVIRNHSWKLRGVVNGIDEKEWNPEIDPCLREDGYSNYSISNLQGKAACKAALQRELGFPVRSNVPLLGFIGRLDNQKGVDIIADAMPWMMSQDLQLVMLGSGRADLENMLRHFEHSYRDKVRGWVGFSVKMAHRITAGADILLMPSRFEPCGLNQLYAMKYGTVPVVHGVGGLRDTVTPFDPFSESGLGWTFNSANADGLIEAIGNAMWTYLDYKQSWEGIQRRGMSQDLSWDNAAQLYEEVVVAAKYQW